MHVIKTLRTESAVCTVLAKVTFVQLMYNMHIFIADLVILLSKRTVP